MTRAKLARTTLSYARLNRMILNYGRPRFDWSKGLATLPLAARNFSVVSALTGMYL